MFGIILPVLAWFVVTGSVVIVAPILVWLFVYRSLGLAIPTLVKVRQTTFVDDFPRRILHTHARVLSVRCIFRR